MNMMTLKAKFEHFLRACFKWRIPLFMLLLVIVYGFVVWRVQMLANVTPTQAQIDKAQTATATSPHINQADVDKIKQLQDNSVTVQGLFDQARQNPFHE